MAKKACLIARQVREKSSSALGQDSLFQVVLAARLTKPMRVFRHEDKDSTCWSSDATSGDDDDRKWPPKTRCKGSKLFNQKSQVVFERLEKDSVLIEQKAMQNKE